LHNLSNKEKLKTEILPKIFTKSSQNLHNECAKKSGDFESIRQQSYLINMKFCTTDINNFIHSYWPIIQIFEHGPHTILQKNSIYA